MTEKLSVHKYLCGIFLGIKLSFGVREKIYMIIKYISQRKIGERFCLQVEIIQSQSDHSN